VRGSEAGRAGAHRAAVGGNEDLLDGEGDAAGRAAAAGGGAHGGDGAPHHPAAAAAEALGAAQGRQERGGARRVDDRPRTERGGWAAVGEDGPCSSGGGAGKAVDCIGNLRSPDLAVCACAVVRK
jgi:hypothetical protein